MSVYTGPCPHCGETKKCQCHTAYGYDAMRVRIAELEARIDELETALQRLLAAASNQAVNDDSEEWHDYLDARRQAQLLLED